MAYVKVKKFIVEIAFSLTVNIVIVKIKWFITMLFLMQYQIKKGGRSDPFKILIYKFLLLWNELNYYIFFFFFSYGKCAFRCKARDLLLGIIWHVKPTTFQTLKIKLYTLLGKKFKSWPNPTLIHINFLDLFFNYIHFLVVKTKKNKNNSNTKIFTYREFVP